MVPGAERKALALEAGDGEGIGEKIGAEARDIGLSAARYRLADRTHGKPSRIIALSHDALGEALEAVLHLRTGILLIGAVPGDGDQSLRPDHGPRVVISIGHVFTESLGGIRHPQDVVRRRALRHLGHLRLYLLMA